MTNRRGTRTAGQVKTSFQLRFEPTTPLDRPTGTRTPTTTVRSEGGGYGVGGYLKPVVVRVFPPTPPDSCRRITVGRPPGAVLAGTGLPGVLPIVVLRPAKDPPFPGRTHFGVEVRSLPDFEAPTRLSRSTSDAGSHET